MNNKKKFPPPNEELEAWRSQFHRELKAMLHREKKWLEIYEFIWDNEPSDEWRARLLKVLSEKKGE